MQQNILDGKLALFRVMAWCRRRQAITWFNVNADLCRHMTRCGHHGLNMLQMMPVFVEFNCVLAVIVTSISYAYKNIV